MAHNIFKLGWRTALVLLVVAGSILSDNYAIAACCDKAGDANNDGVVNVGDAVFVINYIFKGGDAPPCLAEGDANADDAVNVGDAVYVINYIFKGGPEPICQAVIDIDGNVYQTVVIGTQVWMAENLKVTHYRNGDAIPIVTDGGIWAGLTTGAYCNYDNDANNVATYGRLYNWHSVADSRSIALAGWHVASDAEWKQLEMYLGMSQAQADATGWRGTTEGGKLKEAGTTHWLSPNTGATNESLFSALPGGYRYYDGYFYGMGNFAIFWSSSEGSSSHAWSRGLDHNYSDVYRYSNNGEYGYSIRCVRD